jgi:2-hydroxy-4-carboxymuconate semialdehyde hemiacetal dehydrogenase
MSKTIKVALAGAGAFGIKHLDGIKNIDGVEVVSLISRDLEKTKEVADKYGIHHVTTDLAAAWLCPKSMPSFCARPLKCTLHKAWLA